MINLKEVFPFKKKSVGVDISDYTIEVVELTASGGKIQISSMGRAKLRPGIVEKGKIKDEDALANSLKEVFAKAKPQPIRTEKLVFGLPESQVYTHIFSAKFDPSSKEKQTIDDLVTQEAQGSIPLESNDLLFSYKVLSQNEEKTEVLLVATSKEVVSKWQRFFQKLNLKVEAFDIEILATFRGLSDKIPSKPVCLVDIGAITTNIGIFDETGLKYSYSINVAGNSLTREIGETLKMPFKEAEKLKIEKGLTDKSGRVFPILIKALQPILEEIKLAFEYFKERTEKEVGEIVLVGGSSKLKEITDYFKTNLNLPTRIGKLVLLPRGTSLKYLEYIEAAGLALRKLDQQWSQKDPAIYPK